MRIKRKFISLLLASSLILSDSSFACFAESYDYNGYEGTMSVVEQEILSDDISISENEILSWTEWENLYAKDYKDLTKDERIKKKLEYQAYRESVYQAGNTEYRDGASSGRFSNDYLEVAVTKSGRFTIGNIEGNPNYSSDDEQKLLYGHPSSETSETLIKINNDEYWFEADSTSYTKDSAVSVMTISAYKIKVVQTLKFVSSGNVNFDDTVRISYRIVNQGNYAQNVGVRIMLDTMLADNDDAPFKVTGKGNVTEVTNYTGNEVPSSYQVYDNLDSPTTLASGYLKKGTERVPDKVQFTSWVGINDSSWNYEGSVGSNLGDSAVGIYFNPKSVGSNQSMEVATYYGVGLGTINNSGQNSSVKGNEVEILVKESGSGKIVSDADVKMIKDGYAVTEKTKSDGTVTFSDFSSTTKNVSFQVKKEGYVTKKFDKLVKGGTKIVLPLKLNTDTTPEIESVTLAGNDVLNDTINYIENSNKEIEKSESSKVKEIVLKAKSDMPDCTYFLVQDEKTIGTSKTGEFKFKTASVKSGTVIETLKSGANLYIQCVSADGKKSSKTKLGIKVSIPSVSASNCTILDFWPSESASFKDTGLGKLILGNKVEFGLKKPKNLNVTIETTEDGTLQVGINLKKMPKSAADRKDLFKGITEKKFPKKLRDEYVNSKSSVSLFTVTPTLTICGYGEGKIENGTVRVDVVTSVTGAVDASYTSNYFYVIPFYIKLGVGGSVNATAKFNLHNDRGFQFVCYEGTLTPSVNATVEGGIGTKGVVSIGAEGKAELSYTRDLVTAHSKATLKGTATIVVGAWKFEKKLKLAEGTLKIYDSNDNKDKAAISDNEDNSLMEQLKEQPFQLKSQNYLKNQDSREGANGDNSDFSQVESVDSSPVLVESNGVTYKFWLQATCDGDISNDSRLVYSKYVDDAWSEVNYVDNDDTADFYYDVKENNGKIYIVWQDTNKKFDDNTVTIEEMAKAAEINYCVLDAKKDSLSEVIELTNNNYMDTLPVVTVAGSTAYVAWYYTKNFSFDNETNNYIHYVSVKSSGAVSTVKSYNCGTKSVSQLKAMQQDNRPVVVFNLFSDEDEIETDGLYTIDMSISNADAATITDEKNVGNVVDASLNGKKMTFWVQGGNIVYATSFTETPSKVFDFDEGEDTFFKEFTVLDMGERTYILWNSKNNDNDHNLICATYYENGEWSAPYKITELAKGEIRNLSARNENNQIIILYMHICYDDDGEIESSRMVEKNINERADIGLDDVYFDSDKVEPGVSLPIEMTLSNLGNCEVDKVHVTIKCCDDVYEKTINNFALKEGDKKTVNVNYIVPDCLEENEVCDISINVYAEDDVDPENGMSDESIGFTHIISEKQESVIIDNEEYYVIKLSNVSRINASNVKIKVLADSENGTIIYDNIFDNLDAGESEYIYIPKTALDDSTEAYVYMDSDTPMDNEGSEYWMFTCGNEMFFETVENELIIENSIGGEVEGSDGIYNSFDEVHLKASAEDGYIFDGWETDAGVFSESDNEETVFNMPETGATVKANFVEDTPIRTLRISNYTEEIYVGEEMQIDVTATGLNSWNQLSWSSSNEDVAIVDKKGNLVALSSGETVITVVSKANSSKKASCTIIVKDRLIESIEMPYYTYELDEVGQVEKIDVFVNPEDYSEDIVWSSDNESVVSVDDDGVICANKPGKAVIMAANSDGTIFDKCTIYVLNPLTEISLSENDFKMNIGTEKRVDLKYNPEDTTDNKDVIWTNYSSDIVEITASGSNMETLNIKALNTGTAIIEADVNGRVTYLIVEVIIPVNKIEMRTTLSIEEGTYYEMDYRIEPYNSTESINWSSSDSAVVEVNGGYLHAKKKGTAVIRVESSSGKYAICTVTVTERKYEDTQLVSHVSNFESPHPYANNMERMYIYTKSGASQIQATFSNDTYLEDGYDYIYIQDQNGNEIGRYTGRELAGKTIVVSGSTLKVIMVTDGSGKEYGFKIVALRESYDITKSTISVGKQYYTGGALTPKPIVKVGNTILSENVDYTINYTNNVNVGMATLIIQGIGSSAGNKSVNFEIILPELSKISSLKQVKTTTKGATLNWVAVKGATGYQVFAYNSSKKKYKLVKTINGANVTSYKITKLKEGKNYKYAVCAYMLYNSNKISVSPKTYITVKTATKAPSLKGKRKTNKTILLSWKKVAKADGYEIYVSSKSKGKYKKAATIKKGKIVSKKIKLKEGKTGYYKIRTYRKSGSGKIYSAFSNIKKVK